MINQQLIIGLDCGASFTKVRIIKNNQTIFEKDDFPGVNMDLLSPSSFDFISEIKKYSDAYWVIALAGLDSDREKLEAQTKWQEILSTQNLKVISDIELLLWAGSNTGDGIALIAGTGSNCLGKNNSGQTYKVGGMSHLLSDEGSGYYLGSECLHLVTKMADGRVPKNELLQQTLDLYQQETIVDLKNYLLAHPHQKAEIARSATLIISSNDPIVDNAISELALMVDTVSTKLPNIVKNLYLAGSLFKSDSYKGKITVKLPDYNISLVNPLDGVLNFVQQLE